MSSSAVEVSDKETVNLANVTPAAATAEESFARKAFRSFCGNKFALVSAIILLTIILSTILAGVISPYSPLEGHAKDRLLPIGSPGHILGTDEQGRDMLTRMLYGGRMTLLAGFVPVIVAACLGGGLGIIAGYFGGRIGTLIMRVLDIFYAFPAVILSIAISAALGQGLLNIMISIAIVFTPPVARVMETAVKRIRNQEFIEAAKSSGAGPFAIMRRHVLPNVFSDLFVFSTSQISLGIVIAAGLSFLGLGVEPHIPECGNILKIGSTYLETHSYLAIFPGLCIMLLVLSFNFFGDGLRDAFDPKTN